MATVITKNSSTASAVPAAGSLVQGELAVNVTDKKLYTKDSGGNVVKVVGSLGNQEASAVAITGGSVTGITDLAVADGGTGASTASGARTNLGLGSIATQDSSNVAITGGSITGITDLAVADGGTGASTASGARTNLGLVIGTDVPSPTGTGASGTWGISITGNAATATNGVVTTGTYADPAWITSLAGSKITGNISGNAANVTGTVAIANGGTGITAFGTGVQTALGQNVTGSGSIVLATSPSLTTPNLGTPSAATLTNATGLPIATGVSGLGTGVATALAVNTGSSGAFVVNGGALGTPSSGTLTNATGLPVSTGVSGLGTGVATALAVNTGSAGAFVVNGGALGTPSSGTLTNATGLPLSTGVTGTLAVANGGTGVTTSTGTGNTVLSTSPTLVTPNLGTPSSATLTNATGLPLSTGVTGTLPVANGGTGQTSYTDGQLLIGNTATGSLSKATLTAGTNVTITNGNGTITIAATGGGSTSPGGSNTQLQYNNSGSFAGASGLVTDGTNLTLNGQADLRFADSDSSNWVAFQAPATIASNVTWTLPSADGTNGQVLSTNGSGTLSWASAGSSQWTTSGSDIYYTTGNVAVGTTSTTFGGNTQRFSVSGAKTYSEGQPRAQLVVSDSTAQAAGVGGAVMLVGVYDGSGNTTGFASVEAAKENGTSGNYAGALVLKSRSNGGNLTERARFNSTGALVLAGGTATADGIGITFPATQSASSDANTLDDYEEGTWTPSLGGNTTYFGGSSGQVGRYTKIGRVVYATAYVNVSTLGTGSSRVITGLPFSSAAQQDVESCCSVAASNCATAVVSFEVFVISNEIRINSRTAASTTAGQNSIFGNGANIEIGIVYNTA